MTFKYTAMSTANNFVSTWKILLYRLIIGVLMLCIGVSLVLPNIVPLIEEMEAARIFIVLEDIFNDVLSLELNIKDCIDALSGVFAEIVNIILMSSQHLVRTYLALAITILVWRFLSELAEIPFGIVLNASMRMNANISFGLTYVRTLRLSVKYALARMLIAFPIDAVIVVVAALLFVGCAQIALLFAPFVSMLFIVISVSLRVTLLFGWLPAIITDEMSIWRALGANFAALKQNFWRIFSNAIVLVLLTITGLLIVAVFTMGAGLLVIAPASVVMFRCFAFISYYGISAKRYYADEDLIVTPVENEFSKRYNSMLRFDK